MANQGIKMKASIVPRFFPPSRPTITVDGSESSGPYVEPVEETISKADDTSEKVAETSTQRLASAVLEEDGEIAVFEEDGEIAVFEEDGESAGLEEDGESAGLEEDGESAGFEEDGELSLVVGEKGNKTTSGSRGNIPSGQGMASSYIMFVQHERKNLIGAEPHAKLDLPALRQKWSKKRVDEKKVFEDMVQAKKDVLGEEFRKDIRINKLTEVEKRRRKAEADKKYKDKVRKEKSEEQKEQGSVKVKIEEMLSSKLEKMDQLKNYMENLECEVQKTQKMKKDNIEQIVTKDLELMVLKEKFKVLHKVHKKCAKDYMENE